MADIKNQVQGLDPNVRARDVKGMVNDTKSIYETLNIITKRAKQLQVDIKHELHNKLEEFAVTTDAIEEVTENKEQIEISKFYERLPNPVLIATEEFNQDELHYHYRDSKKEDNF